jgi:hypothetical protein
MGGSSRTITRTIREFPVGEDQAELRAMVAEIVQLMEEVHRFGRVMLVWHEGCLVHVEVERSVLE